MEVRPFNLIVGNQRLPLDIHAVGLDAGGHLIEAERRDFSFRFTYRRILLSVRFRSGEAPIVEIQGQLGSLPFSAESAVLRGQLMAIIRSANEHLGGGFQIARGRIRLSGSIEVAAPVTAVGLVGAIARFLLPRKPYLEIIDVCLGQDPAPARRRGQRGGMMIT